MKRKLLTTTGFIIAAGLVISLAAEGQAGIFDKFRRNKRANPEGIQMAAAMYSGSLQGEIRLNGTKVKITDKTLVYVVGRGSTKNRSMVLHERPVAATGSVVDGVLVADMIMVRPEQKTIYRASKPSRRPSTPGANPNVAILEPWDGE